MSNKCSITIAHKLFASILTKLFR